MIYHRILKISNTTDATSRAGIAYPSKAPVFTSVLLGFLSLNIYVVCVVLCRSLFVFLAPFLWPLYCLSFNKRFLNTSLVSSSFSQLNETDKLSCYEHILTISMHTKTSTTSYLTIGKYSITCESLIISFFITFIKLTIVDNVLLLIKLVVI